jgi:hypothetical protein
MRIHKYSSKDGAFYVLGPSSTRPLKGETITGVKWMGWANPGNKGIVELGELSYSREEEPKEEPKKEEKKSYSVMDFLRQIAQESMEKKAE